MNKTLETQSFTLIKDSGFVELFKGEGGGCDSSMTLIGGAHHTNQSHAPIVKRYSKALFFIFFSLRLLRRDAQRLFLNVKQQCQDGLSYRDR
jgi:hypothetical protein